MSSPPAGGSVDICYLLFEVPAPQFMGFLSPICTGFISYYILSNKRLKK